MNSCIAVVFSPDAKTHAGLRKLWRLDQDGALLGMFGGPTCPAYSNASENIARQTLITLLATASMIADIGLVVPAHDEATKQTVVLTEVDPVVLATGWRATDIIRAKVYDLAGTEIGTLEDMIITTSGTVLYAVVSVSAAVKAVPTPIPGVALSHLACSGRALCFADQ